MIQQAAKLAASLLRRDEVWVLVGWRIIETHRENIELCFSGEKRIFTLDEMFARLRNCQKKTPLEVYLEHSKLTSDEQSYYVKYIDSPTSCLVALLDETRGSSIVAFERRFSRIYGRRQLAVTQACISEEICKIKAKKLPVGIRHEIIRIEQ